MNGYIKILHHPVILLAICLAMTLAAASQLRHFTFDASSDTLVVQGDPELLVYNEMTSLFGGDDFVVLTYSSPDVFSPPALAEINDLQEQLNGLDGVASTFSILDAPLIESPPIPLELLAENYRTLRTPDIDLQLAKQELTRSPLLSDYLISHDGSTTAISASLKRDHALEALMQQRDAAIAEDSAETTEIEAAFAARRAEYVSRREQLIAGLRAVKDNYSGEARLFISGVPMIAADMLSYVRSDLVIFGSLVFVLIVALLALFFRMVRWVVIPVCIVFATLTITIGFLGLMRTPVTVVSSNFISLLAIISISFSIHLIVRYRELSQSHTGAHISLVAETMRSKFAPCFYTALTTLLAFGSMIGSRIVPIIDFGWMMCLGIVIALIMTYLLFPALLLLMGQPTEPRSANRDIAVTNLFRDLSTMHPGKVTIASLIILAPAFWGLTLISFDNRFVDYFSSDTDIYKGMSQIDQYLGGTLPLDIYLRFEQFETGEDDFSDEDDFFDDTEEPYPERYWFTPEKINTLRILQAELEKRPETGKVISLASMEQMGRRFNDGDALRGIEIAYVLGELPPEVRSIMIEPYARPSEGWMRINTRIRESTNEFSKQDLINDIRQFSTRELRLEEEDVVVTGMVVLFNDMLKQLADSQARTFAYVIAATFVMFSILLRSLPLALIALIPNVIAALLIIASMGFAGIPMDMMTITIAAICIGIGVDDAIHYLHRFREELNAGMNTSAAVMHSHDTIGHAMYFTTMTIMGGFSVLAFSNFIPTVYFGLLTALAMALALIANMSLLPSLLMLFYRRSDLPG